MRPKPPSLHIKTKTPPAVASPDRDASQGYDCLAVSVKFTRAPFPRGDTHYVDAIALEFGVSRKRIWNLLSQHRHRLHPAMYKGRNTRVLTPADYEFLRSLFTVRVKTNLTSHQNVPTTSQAGRVSKKRP